MTALVEIPDDLYRELEESAAREGVPVSQIILQRVSTRANASGPRPTYPLVSSKEPGSMKLGEEGIYEYISFP